jgi:hypothetical protein
MKRVLFAVLRLHKNLFDEERLKIAKREKNQIWDPNDWRV